MKHSATFLSFSFFYYTVYPLLILYILLSLLSDPPPPPPSPTPSGLHPSLHISKETCEIKEAAVTHFYRSANLWPGCYTPLTGK